MARIRSIHPGWFTDESWVSVSIAARILGIGIWTECDDQGAFEWKPVTLKMRIFPADNIDVEALIAELQEADLVRKYEHGGKSYGVVKNFQRFQRPKKPNSTHFIPPEFRTYIGSSDASSELSDVKEASVPKKSEMSPQMEDGGWREGEKKGKTGADRAGSEEYAFVGKVIKLRPDDMAIWRKRYSAIPDIQAELASLDDFYASDQCSPAERKNWFIRCSKALDNRHQEAVRKRTEAAKPVAKWAI